VVVAVTTTIRQGKFHKNLTIITTAEWQKIGFDPICYGTAVTAQRQVGIAMAQRNFVCRQRNSYGAYGILTEFV